MMLGGNLELFEKEIFNKTCPQACYLKGHSVLKNIEICSLDQTYVWSNVWFILASPLPSS